MHRLKQRPTNCVRALEGKDWGWRVWFFEKHGFCHAVVGG